MRRMCLKICLSNVCRCRLHLIRIIHDLSVFRAYDEFGGRVSGSHASKIVVAVIRWYARVVGSPEV